MAYYMVQAAYTAEAIAAMVKKPEDRAAAIRPVVEKLGGKLEGIWFCFGEYDVVGISELPDNVSAAAFAFAVSQGGKVKALRTTPLMTGDEAVKAMKKAAGAGYRPPGG
ncbi:MAG: GYD domain-containing protein [Betaproteobacteria bacterium RBG_16_66_20]|nr:MAG: GYD domain-containing protein [Betaproteobacteria bacterium RBG_16_66_20]